MVRALAILAAGLGLVPSAALAAELPTLDLPPTERARDWEAAAELAGLRLGHRGADAHAALTADEDGVRWRLEVVDHAGGHHELWVTAPRDPRDREELALLAASLVRPLPSAPPSPSAATPPRHRRLGSGFGGLERHLQLRRPTRLQVREHRQRIGVGPTVGAPIGLSVRAGVGGGRLAVEATVGVRELPGSQATVGLRWTVVDLVVGRSGQAGLQVGAGGLAWKRSGWKKGDPPELGGRAQVGVWATMLGPRLECFGDVNLDVVDHKGPELHLSPSVGVRYLF